MRGSGRPYSPLLLVVAGIMASWALASTSHAQTVSVPGTANIFAAGQTRVQSLSGGGGTLPPNVDVSGAASVTVSASGLTNCCASTPNSPPDGTTAFNTSINSLGAISGIIGPRAMFLVGVFLGSGAPSGSAPPRLDFNVLTTDATSYRPLLQQVFFIGDGRTSRGVAQSFSVPAGASRLFLGVADAFAFNGNPGFYDDNRGAWTVTVTRQVRVAEPLRATASGSPTSGPAPLAVNFTASASGGTSPYTFAWTFGDGQTSSAQNPTTTYRTAGTFTATLTVTDAQRETASASVTVTVSPAVAPLRATASGNPTSGPAPLTVAFRGSASGGTSPYTFAWTFGDGQTSSAQNPTTTYRTAGTFTATLTVTDAQRQTASEAVTVVVGVAVAPLRATASASPTSGPAPLAVSFTASASGGTSPYTFAWAFGDGQTSSAQNPTTTYRTAGTFTATVTVTDAQRATASASVTVTVSPAAAALRATASASPTSGPAPLAVEFMASATGGTSPYTFAWAFGDGQTSREQNPTTTYRTAGTFTASVTVTDARGQTASEAVTVVVATTPVGTGATLQLTANSTRVAPGDRLIVTLSTSPPPQASVVDLYAAVRRPASPVGQQAGPVLFFTGDPFRPFSDAAVAFRSALRVTSTSFEVLNFVVPDTLPPGPYTFLAAYIEQGRPPTITGIIGDLAQLEVTISAVGAPLPPVEVPCSGTVQLFPARPIFSTGPGRTAAEATTFSQTTKTIAFPSGARAVIASDQNGTGSFAVDNLLSINGNNVCPAGGSCFGTIRDTSITVIGLPIERAVDPIPPLDVSSAIPRGRSTVSFELQDFGVIAGNTDLYLVLTGPGCVPTAGAGVGSISGTVRDSVTGEPLPGASVSVGGGGGSAVTGPDGSFTIANVPAGVVTVSVELAGFSPASRSVTVEANQTASANLALSRPLPTGQVRIVLSWGREPRDLDAHLTGSRPGLQTGEGERTTERFHVFFRDRGSLTSEPRASLDRDDTDGVGPETITITDVRPGVYRYSVHDFTNRASRTSTALSQSNASVTVFIGGDQVASFEVPKNRVGTVWTVFELEGRRVRPIDTLGLVSEPGDITRFALSGGEDPALFRNLLAK
jgi:PKD repeat protein